VLKANNIVTKAKRNFHSMNPGYLFFLLIFNFLFSSFTATYAQENKKIRIERADTFQGGRDETGRNYRKLVGNVKLKQETTEIFGDSVVLYPDSSIAVVTGKEVKVIESDTITLTGNELRYNGLVKFASMKGDVVYTDPSLQLFSSVLDYDIAKNQVFYYGGGKLVDSVNTLTSLDGTYNTITKRSAFKDDVVLTNPRYVLNSDTLEYNTQSKIAYTEGPTEIIDDNDNVLTAQKGSEFYTAQKQSVFEKGTVESDDYIISGDRLFFDDITSYYTATGNVEMLSKENDIIITGDYARYEQDKGETRIFGEPLMKKVLDVADTFYLVADTLFSLEGETDSDNRILAYNEVKLHRNELSGIADSMAYHVSDSMIYFYNDPVLWSAANQITADTISLELKNNTLKYLNAAQNSFVISRDTLKNYNQLKGRKLRATFVNGYINQLQVNGNGESIYHVLEGDTLLVGLNRILCGKLDLYFKDNQVNNIRFYNNPEARFIPPIEITSELARLEGFAWRNDERPCLKELLYQQPCKEATSPKEPDNNNLLMDNKAGSLLKGSKIPDLKQKIEQN
jgi:lipopolysaccharide export system protein LptA